MWWLWLMFKEWLLGSSKDYPMPYVVDISPYATYTFTEEKTHEDEKAEKVITINEVHDQGHD